MEENYDIIVPLSAEGLFSGWEWQKPCTAEGYTEIGEFFRDRVLHPVRHTIEQQAGFDKIISFDGEDMTRPMQIRWKTQITPTTSWSGKWGVVCQGMRITELRDEQEHPVAMVQLGGTWIEPEEFQHLPAGAFIREFFKKRQRRCYLLLLESYFLTRWSIENYTMDGEAFIKEPEALWHHVSEDMWLSVVDCAGTAMVNRGS